MAEPLRIPVKKENKTIAWNRPSLTKKELVSVLNCLIDDDISYGPLVGRFEKEFARNFRFRHAAATSSPATALHLAFMGLELEAGDEIIVSSLSNLAVADAARYVGAELQVVDPEPKSFHPSLDSIMSRIGPRTKAVFVDHIFGSYFPHTAELAARLENLSKDKDGQKIVIIEDISAVLGKDIGEDYAGVHSKIALVNLDQDQMLTIGRGAILGMSDSKLYGRIHGLRNPAGRDKGDIRYDYNISDMQAAMGLEQLDHLPLLLERRQKVGKFLLSVLTKTKYETYFNDPESDTYLHFPVATTLGMDRIERFFKSQNIEIRRICEMPLHRHLNLNRMDYPNTEKLWMRSVRIPCYPNLSKSDTERLDFALRSLY